MGYGNRARQNQDARRRMPVGHHALLNNSNPATYGPINVMLMYVVESKRARPPNPDINSHDIWSGNFLIAIAQEKKILVIVETKLY